MSLDALIFERQPDAGSAQSDCGMADLFRLVHNEHENARTPSRRRATTSIRGSGRVRAKPLAVGRHIFGIRRNAQPIDSPLQSENDRRRIELEHGMRLTPSRHLRPEKRLVKRAGAFPVTDRKANLYFRNKHG
jgi:hypothetical protein